MKSYLLLYRADFATVFARTPEEKEASDKKWIDWITSIAEQNKLADRGQRLDLTGRVVKAANVVTNGPYTEIKETLGGFSVVKAETYEEAVEMAKGCPVLSVGGNVEVRELVPMN